jgi:hypothetical protein
MRGEPLIGFSWIEVGYAAGMMRGGEQRSAAQKRKATAFTVAEL